jgi:hypothetical protein
MTSSSVSGGGGPRLAIGVAVTSTGSSLSESVIFSSRTTATLPLIGC